jgi:hypothetical protein
MTSNTTQHILHEIKECLPSMLIHIVLEYVEELPSILLIGRRNPGKTEILKDMFPYIQLHWGINYFQRSHGSTFKTIVTQT